MRFILSFLLTFIFICLPPLAHAEDKQSHTLYAHPTSQGMAAGAVFGGFSQSVFGDTLLSAASPVCGHVEIHTVTENDDGILQMREIESLPIPSDQSFALEPMGYHLMLMAPKNPLKEGDTIPLTLTFKKAGDVKVTVPVIPRGQKGRK